MLLLLGMAEEKMKDKISIQKIIRVWYNKINKKQRR